MGKLSGYPLGRHSNSTLPSEEMRIMSRNKGSKGNEGGVFSAVKLPHYHAMSRPVWCLFKIFLRLLKKVIVIVAVPQNN